MTNPSECANPAPEAENPEAPAAPEAIEGETEPAEAASEPADQASAGAEVAALSERVAELEAALQDHREQVLRAQAEVENTRRRAQRDVENAHKFGLEKFVNEMLPVVDSMELGLKAAEQDGAGVEALVEGTELTLKMLLNALERFEVAPVDPENARFDPELHQAMSMMESEEADAGTVLQVFQKGYTLSGRLVRPAMVIVAK